MGEVPLREHLEWQIRTLDKMFEKRIEEIKEATSVALRTFPTKEDIDRRLNDVESRQNEIEKMQAYARGRAAAYGALGGSAMSIVALLVGWWLGR